jgi:hypothetical protein
MKDYLQRNKILDLVSDVRYAWSKIPSAYRPRDFDLEPVLKSTLRRVPTPEISYRIDELKWVERFYDGAKCPGLPDLPLAGLTVEGPVGKKRTWKVVVAENEFSRAIVDRFGLDRNLVLDTLYAISRTSTHAILRYPSAEAAKEAVEEALLKIGLVGPIVGPEEMHTITGYDE